MRIIGKAKRNDNGYPFICVMTLLKDSEIKHPKDGFTVWNGYGRVERIPKGERDQSVIYSVTALSPLADNLIAWPKGTVLLIAGNLVRDEYWSKRNGTDVFKIMAEFVHDQHNYAAASTSGGSAGNDNDDGVFDESSYDPGF